MGEFLTIFFNEIWAWVISGAMMAQMAFNAAIVVYLVMKARAAKAR